MQENLAYDEESLRIVRAVQYESQHKLFRSIDQQGRRVRNGLGHQPSKDGSGSNW